VVQSQFDRLPQFGIPATVLNASKDMFSAFVGVVNELYFDEHS
jgi:hypothetical protein